jgi:hypothetical protein
VDVVKWSRALDVRLSEWCGFKSRRGKYKNLTALKSNSNTVWVNFQTYIDIYIYSNNVFYCKLYMGKTIFILIFALSSTISI